MTFAWLAPVDPRWGTALHAIVWVALLVWVWRRPAAEVYQGTPDRARWRDLRWWVVPLAIAQVGLYLLFWSWSGTSL